MHHPTTTVPAHGHQELAWYNDHQPPQIQLPNHAKTPAGDIEVSIAPRATSNLVVRTTVMIPSP